MLFVLISIINITTSKEVKPVDIKITLNGKGRTISTSKIKKIIVTRKNRKEKKNSGGGYFES